MAQELVSISRLSKSFKGRVVYRDASAIIRQGRITALTGPNGSGKSLLFRMICGFVRPDAGVIAISPEYLPAKRQFPLQFGVIIDQPGFVNHLTGMQNMEVLAGIRKVIGPDEIRATMLRFGLDPELKQRVRNYSLGMRQKLALTQAFMERPKVLVLDEPFNGLDAESYANVRTALTSFRSSGGSIVFCSHNPVDVELLADDVLEVSSERLVEVKRA